MFDCNVNLKDSLERAGISEEVPRARMYYVEAENNSRELLKLAEHRVSVACELNLSSDDRLEDNKDPEDSVSQASASSARLKAAALMAHAQVLNDGLELKRKQLQLQHNQEQLSLRGKISEVEAEERVYQMFQEEKGGWSHRTCVVRSSVKKSLLTQTPQNGQHVCRET